MLGCWLLLAPAAALAADGERDADAEALALEAKAALEQYCSDAAGDDVTLAAESVATVSAVWAKVSAALEESRKVYLLYWRGVLGQCLDQEDKALADLQSFVEARGDRSEWAGLAQDARRRIRQIERSLGGSSTATTGPGPGTGGVVAGIVLGAAGGGLGGVAAWQYAVGETRRQEMYGGLHVPNGDLDVFLAQESQAVLLHQVFTIGAAATGATGLALLIAGGAVNGSARPVAVLPYGQPDGVGVVVMGAW